MTFTGTLVKDLLSLVESCLESNRICAICGQQHDQHLVSDGCPDSALVASRQRRTRFAEAS